MNNVELTGRLTKDARISSFDSGSKCASFTLATSRFYKNKDGGYITYYVPCICWGKTADVIEKFTGKGSMIAISDGYIQTRSYTNTHEEKVFVTEVVVERVELLDKKKKEQEPQEEGFDMNSLFTEDDSEVPF